MAFINKKSVYTKFLKGYNIIFFVWSLSLSSFCLIDFFDFSSCFMEKFSPRFRLSSAIPPVISSSCCSKIALCLSMDIGIFQTVNVR